MSGIAAVFSVEPRKLGKSASGQYRKGRKVPAVIYGPKIENKNCLIDEIFVLKHSGARHESAIFETNSTDKSLSALKVMLKRIDHHPVSNRPIHVDLYALDMTVDIRVNVQLEFEGSPAGVKEGGVLQVVMREVEIECKPTSIPESIKVDISGIELNGSLHVSDITFPQGVTAITSPDRTICTVHIPKEESTTPPPAEATDAAASTETAEKKD